MRLGQLREEVLQANLELVRQGLVTLTWGNVSAVDREQGLLVIKPSGVAYAELEPARMAVVDFDGKTIEGLRPSSDTPTHLELYRAWPEVGAVAHTHSHYAAMFAQACRPLPCLGSTHADHFHGEVPVTRSLTQAEVEGKYERNTGKVIVERFADLDALAVPAVLVANHGPFTWGRNIVAAVANAVALEAVAKMALGTMTLAPAVEPIAPYLLDKHYRRKHGADAYYGQGE